MTAEDFVAGIKDFSSFTPGLQTDLLLIYLVRFDGRPSATATAIEDLRKTLHLPHQAGLANYLSRGTDPKCTKPVKFVKAKLGYIVERGYAEQLIQSHLRRPTAIATATNLRAASANITDTTVREYADEAVACFENQLMRASVVMTWCVAYGLLRTWIFNNHLAALNAQMGTWKTPGAIAKLDDFQEYLEGVILETARKAHLISKELHKTFKSLLDTRNSYAHPSAKPISSSIAEAYIETVLSEVVPQLS